MTKPQPRQRKTARQRAEEALGVAQRKRDRLAEQAEHYFGLLKGVEAELAEAERRLDYASKDPALAQGASTTTGTTKSGDDTA